MSIIKYKLEFCFVRGGIRFPQQSGELRTIESYGERVIFDLIGFMYGTSIFRTDVIEYLLP